MSDQVISNFVFTLFTTVIDVFLLLWSSSLIGKTKSFYDILLCTGPVFKICCERILGNTVVNEQC